MKNLALLLFSILINIHVSKAQSTQKVGEGAAYILPPSNSAAYLGSVIAANREIMAENRKIGSENYRTALSYLDSKDFDSAILDFKSALSAFKSSGLPKIDIDNCLLFLALCYAQKDDKGYCLDYLSKISKNKKKNRDIAFGMGNIYVMIKENDLAEIQFLNAIKLDKYFKNGYRELLNLYLVSNNTEKEKLLKEKMQINSITLN